jgi:hypothetical protein
MVLVPRHHRVIDAILIRVGDTHIEVGKVSALGDATLVISLHVLDNFCSVLTRDLEALNPHVEVFVLRAEFVKKIQNCETTHDLPGEVKGLQCLTLDKAELLIHTNHLLSHELLEFFRMDIFRRRFHLIFAFLVTE